MSNLTEPFEVESYEDLDGDGVDDAAFTGPFDIDGDGYSESVAGDVNLDGVIESVYMDLDGDGMVETTVLDADLDGEADTIWIDADGDYVADVTIEFDPDVLTDDSFDSFDMSDCSCDDLAWS